MWKKNDDWFWEGKVQEELAKYFEDQGYKVISADTLSKSRGVDIFAQKNTSDVFFSIIRRKNKSSKGSIAIGLPQYPRYLSLIEAAKWALEKLEIRIFIVTSIGEVYEQ